MAFQLPRELTLAKFLEQTRGGGNQALENEFILLNQKFVESYVKRMTTRKLGNLNEADDIATEVLWGMIRGFRKGKIEDRGEGTLEALLPKIVGSRIIDKRRAVKEGVISTDEDAVLDSGTLPHHYSGEEDPDEVKHRPEDEETLRLSNEAREYLLLKGIIEKIGDYDTRNKLEIYYFGNPDERAQQINPTEIFEMKQKIRRHLQAQKIRVYPEVDELFKKYINKMDYLRTIDVILHDDHLKMAPENHDILHAVEEQSRWTQRDLRHLQNIDVNHRIKREQKPRPKPAAPDDNGKTERKALEKNVRPSRAKAHTYSANWTLKDLGTYLHMNPPYILAILEKVAPGWGAQEHDRRPITPEVAYEVLVQAVANDGEHTVLHGGKGGSSARMKEARVAILIGLVARDVPETKLTFHASLLSRAGAGTRRS